MSLDPSSPDFSLALYLAPFDEVPVYVQVPVVDEPDRPPINWHFDGNRSTASTVVSDLRELDFRVGDAIRTFEPEFLTGNFDEIVIQSYLNGNRYEPDDIRRRRLEIANNYRLQIASRNEEFIKAHTKLGNNWIKMTLFVRNHQQKVVIKTEDLEKVLSFIISPNPPLDEIMPDRYLAEDQGRIARLSQFTSFVTNHHWTNIFRSLLEIHANELTLMKMCAHLEWLEKERLKIKDLYAPVIRELFNEVIDDPEIQQVVHYFGILWANYDEELWTPEPNA